MQKGEPGFYRAFVKYITFTFIGLMTIVLPMQVLEVAKSLLMLMTLVFSCCSIKKLNIVSGVFDYSISQLTGLNEE